MSSPKVDWLSTRGSTKGFVPGSANVTPSYGVGAAANDGAGSQQAGGWWCSGGGT